MRCGGGTTGADLDAVCQQHGLAVTSGLISHTGIAGLTLGGGFGWLTRMMGLSSDNLAAAEVVVADDRCVRASEDDHPDLFWALRGGGGNFGVVTNFEYRLQPVGPEVQMGLLFWGLELSVEALRLCRAALPPLFEFVTPMPYTALQQMFDDTFHWGIHAYDKSLYLDDLSDEVIDVVAEHLPGKSSPVGGRCYTAATRST